MTQQKTPKEIAVETEARWADRWGDRAMPSSAVRRDLVGYIEELVRAERDEADRRVRAMRDKCSEQCSEWKRRYARENYPECGKETE